MYIVAIWNIINFVFSKITHFCSPSLLLIFHHTATTFWNIFKMVIFFESSSIDGWKLISMVVVLSHLLVQESKTLKHLPSYRFFCRNPLRSTEPLMAFETFWDTFSGISHREGVKLSKLIVHIPRIKIIGIETDFSITLNGWISCQKLLQCKNLKIRFCFWLINTY